MILLRRIGGGYPFYLRLLCPPVFLLWGAGLFSTLCAELPPYQVELRVNDDPSLFLLDNQGKVSQALPRGTVRKRVAVQDTLLLASFGEDNQHRSIIMLGLDISTDHPVTFLFGRNIIVVSPEAMLTFQIDPNGAIAQISPSLMGQIWINGSLLARGETKRLLIASAKTQASSGKEIIPSPEQPKPTSKDFQSIPLPSIGGSR